MHAAVGGRLDRGSLLRLALRFALALLLLVHGAALLTTSAFPEPSASTLTQRLGELTRAELLATFLGASGPYQAFNGAVTALAGLLLLFPATALLGAVLSIVLLGMMAVLSYCYDLPGKAVTLVALAAAMVLAASHAGRFVDALLRNRLAEPVPEPPVPLRVHRIAAAIGLAVFVACTALGVTRTILAHSPAAPALYGVWNVEELSVNGEALAPGDPRWWRYFIVARDGTMQLVPALGPARVLAPGALKLTPIEPHVVTASLDGGTVRLKLHRMQLLQERFHWLLPPEEEE
jgi:hypothetical protein